MSSFLLTIYHAQAEEPEHARLLEVTENGKNTILIQ